jgi:hypothetical protein
MACELAKVIINYVRFEVFTPVIMKNAVFWDAIFIYLAISGAGAEEKISSKRSSVT